MTWFDGAVARAPGYADQAQPTLASTFRARCEGWSRPLDPDQEDALYRARRRLHQIFDEDDYERDDAAEQAERLAARVRDPGVRAALAPTMALFLRAKDGTSRRSLTQSNSSRSIATLVLRDGLSGAGRDDG